MEKETKKRPNFMESLLTVILVIVIEAIIIWIFLSSYPASQYDNPGNYLGGLGDLFAMGLIAIAIPFILFFIFLFLHLSNKQDKIITTIFHTQLVITMLIVVLVIFMFFTLFK
ncbi:MAG: hypothetical protein LBE82_09965 [Chitinophagaceae bacterium]|jgi:predicted neutral ceramidase superfamily lipid hydrolase|nr:hypothetical protein [Chitinophagaceae bacterium]